MPRRITNGSTAAATTATSRHRAHAVGALARSGGRFRSHDRVTSTSSSACTAEATRELLADATAGRLDRRGGRGDRGGGPAPPACVWPNDLTEREVDVLRLCARGPSNRQIAEKLVISARTVQHHLASIYDKTDRHTRAGAAVFAVEHGLATWQ